uniref:Uncharacterized protein n=1 Tax=Arion vulgaris TaxID=1028688 RepID=A0A0B7ARA5_9EUPU
MQKSVRGTILDTLITAEFIADSQTTTTKLENSLVAPYGTQTEYFRSMRKGLYCSAAL